MKNQTKYNLKALVLAAGLGTRLRPLTLKMPKCLAEIGGIPLLENWLNKLEGIDCNETLINTHYFSEKVDAFLQTYNSEKMKINSIYEPNLLGTLGTLLSNKEWFKNSTGMLIHGDNFTYDDLKKFISAHNAKPKQCLLTMLTFKTDNPRNCGIIETDQQGIMTNFFEKVENPPSNIANGAIYLFDYEFIEWIEERTFDGNDFSLNVLPLLKGRVQTFHTNKVFLDIGTPEALAKANTIFENQKDI